jgi:hypothetical protein
VLSRSGPEDRVRGFLQTAGPDAASAPARHLRRGDGRIRTGVDGFAGRCLTPRPRRPDVSTLASRRAHGLARTQLPPAENAFMMFIIAGPSTTMNMVGKMKMTVGNSILIGAFIAFSSAAIWRLLR